MRGGRGEGLPEVGWGAGSSGSEAPRKLGRAVAMRSAGQPSAETDRIQLVVKEHFGAFFEKGQPMFCCTLNAPQLTRQGSRALA